MAKSELGPERWAGFEKLKDLIPGTIPKIKGSMNIYMVDKCGMSVGTLSRSAWLEDTKLRHARQG